MEILNVSTHWIEDTTININAHISAALGAPIKLPDYLTDTHKWAIETEDGILALFKKITGKEYKLQWRDNTYNHANDLDGFAVLTVYAPIGCGDWVWCRDCFIVVEIGAGGDPRYSAYGAPSVYRLEDDCIGDTGLLDWTVGYWLTPVADRYDATLLDNVNDRLSACYSSWPYGKLKDALVSAPVYCERRLSYIARPKGIPYPVTVVPVGPCYPDHPMGAEIMITPQLIAYIFDVSLFTANLAILLIRGRVDPLAYSRRFPLTCDWVKRCYCPPKRLEVKLAALDEILGGCGIEYIRNDDEPRAAYINLGDTYAVTLLFCFQRSRWTLQSWGEYVDALDCI